jgi:ABC-type nitrate/sulfonate/bicarbonate transport system permease component
MKSARRRLPEEHDHVTFCALAQGLWQRLLPWLVPILLLLFWQLASVAGWLNHRVLPAPTEVLVAFWQLLSSGDLFRHLAVSFARVAAGFVIGAGLGLHSACWPGCRGWARRCSIPPCRCCATFRRWPSCRW